MTIEIYRPGVTEPLKIPDGGFFDGNIPGSDGQSILLQSSPEGLGFKRYFTRSVSSYYDFIHFYDEETEEKIEEHAIKIPKGLVLQLADGLIAKAT